MAIKEQIDKELSTIKFTSQMEENVYHRLQKPDKPFFRLTKVASIILSVFLLAGVGVYAGREFWGIIHVNDVTIPDLDNMKIIENDKLTTKWYNSEFETLSYDTIMNRLGVPLLTSELAEYNPYMHTNVKTDFNHYCEIHVQNYILGDTKNHILVNQDTGRCEYDPGEEYLSPVELEINMILSEEQYEIGWNEDYLGYYEYVEPYISDQGYRVNIIQDTSYREAPSGSDAVSRKCFIFVADGIRYTLKGRTSIETMKEIVDGMQY